MTKMGSVRRLKFRNFLLLFFAMAVGCDQEILKGRENNAKITLSTEVAGEDYSTKVKRYILYDVNPGEGFNLKRDIFVRVGPIIKKLNQVDKKSTWVLLTKPLNFNLGSTELHGLILFGNWRKFRGFSYISRRCKFKKKIFWSAQVLHPWGKLAHWFNSSYFPWRTFFQVDEITNYIPAIEFEDFMQEFGLDNHIDGYYQLQHFPLNSPISKLWYENVKEVSCDKRLRFQKANNGLYMGSVWGHAVYTKNASCVGVKGDTSNLVKFFLVLQPRFGDECLLLDKAEVILWDHYGGPDWWEARKSLKFSSHLYRTALNWALAHLPGFNKNNLLSANFIGIHLRRKDFVEYRNNQPSLRDVANQIIQQLVKLEARYAFIASDGNEEEIEFIRSELANNSGSKFTLLRFDCPEKELSDGECAIIDQIICSWSKYFTGTADSTFTLRIFEERELLGIQPEYNYNLLCTGKLKCEKATRWARN